MLSSLNDVLGALSHGLETISITEMAKLQEMIEEKGIKWSGCTCLGHGSTKQTQKARRRCASQGGQTPSKQQPIEGTNVLAQIQAKLAKQAAASCPVTHAYGSRLQERAVQAGLLPPDDDKK